MKSELTKNRRKEVIKVREEINTVECRCIIIKINGARRFFAFLIPFFEKPPTRLIRKKKFKSQIINIWSEKDDIPTDSTDIKRH